jgi:ABC-2 type transport system permease protein
VTNLIYLPTAFASGLFFPLRFLPEFLQSIAPYLPLYRGAQLAWDAVGAPTAGGSVSTDWLFMAGYTVVFFALAMWAYRRDQGRKFN